MEPKAKRRSRYKSHPRGGVGRHGERIGTPTHLTLLDALQDGPLPAPYIHTLLGSHSYGRDVLTLLHGEGLIRIPTEYHGHHRRLAHPNVYELTRETRKGKLSQAEKLLADAGLLRDACRDQFRHALLVSVIRFSFKRAPDEIPGLAYRSLADVLANPRCPDVQDGDYHIRPDSPLFGYEFEGRRTFYLFGFEADRGTEPLTGYGRETLEAKVANYTRYLEDKEYRRRYGLTNIAVPIVTMSAERAQHIIDIIIRPTAGKEADHFIVKSLPNFIRTHPFPPPTAHMVTEDWMTTQGPLNIMEILRGQTRQSEASSGTIGHHQESGSRA
jgi:hypothetical protein